MVDEILKPLEPLHSVDSIEAVDEVIDDDHYHPDSQDRDHAPFHIHLVDALQKERDNEKKTAQDKNDSLEVSPMKP